MGVTSGAGTAYLLPSLGDHDLSVSISVNFSHFGLYTETTVPI
jgi:hypothetical protein